MPLAQLHKICKVISVRRQWSSCFQCYNKEICHLSRQITRKWLVYSQGDRAFAPCVGKPQWTQWQLYLNAKGVLRSTSKKNWILYISHTMRKTVDALMLSIGIDSALYGTRAREKVFYQQRHGTGTWLTSGASTNERATQALSNFCQYLTGTLSTYSFSRKSSEHLTTSFYQQGKAVLTAMDLPVQALRVEAERANIRNHSVILSAFVCLVPYTEGLIS